MAILKKNNKYTSHTYQYDIDGEDLPKRGFNKKVLKKILFLALFLFFVFNYLLNMLNNILMSSFSIITNKKTTFVFSEVFGIENVVNFNFSFFTYVVIFFAVIILIYFIYDKLDYGSEKNIAFGQKGDSRLTSIEEIQEQYKEIPEKGQSFEGMGGVPITHYKDKYYIDTDTTNTIYLGVSRSGKGELGITPMIENISRAMQKCSMVINDPKGELFAASKDLLESRGYRVEVLNIQEPTQSMSYNPLDLVKQSFLLGDEEEGAKKATSITYTMYHKPDAGENAWVNEGAQSAVTAIILALADTFTKNNEMEKLTMSNVSDMLNELGTFYYSDQNGKEYNALDEYFKNLPQGNIAKKKYGSTSFAGDKARGSILSTANQGLEPFVDTKFARMTSLNSMDLKTVGFPKNLKGQLPEYFVGKRITISFHKNNAQKTLINTHKVKVKHLGMFNLSFDDDLSDNDLILIKYQDEKIKHKSIHEIHFKKECDFEGNIIYDKEIGKENVPLFEEDVNLISVSSKNDAINLTMKYCNKPIAIFMIIPDFDASNHTLASIFTKQLYTELAANCLETKSKKTFRRVHFILDEFGNMPPIEGMDRICTVCLGRNILFTLAIQSYQQLFSVFTESVGKTIKDNCQNHIYIISTDEDTIEEISKKAGNRTNIGLNSNERHLDTNNQITKSASEERLITPDRVRQMIPGETIVIRSLKRLDLKGKKVRPFPIFNTKESNMPYRFEFLGDYVDTSNDLNDIDIPSKHANLDLEELKIDFGQFIYHEVIREIYYQQIQQKQYEEKIIKKEDKEEIPGIEGIIKEIMGDLDKGFQEEFDYLNPEIQEFIEDFLSSYFDEHEKISLNSLQFLQKKLVNVECPVVKNNVKKLSKIILKAS